MRDYAKLASTFWVGKTGKSLRQKGATAQLVALYIISSPHSNMLGLYYLPRPYIAHETGLTTEQAEQGLRDCIDVGFCDYDDETEMVWVFEAARFQIAERLSANDKQTKGIANELAKLPASRLLGAFINRYRAAYHLPDEPVPNEQGKAQGSPSKAPSKPGAGAGAGNTRAASPHSEDAPQGFADCWDAYPKREGGNSRKEAAQAYRARLKEGATPDDLLAGVKRYAAYIRTTGKEGTAYVKQAVTFFGPSEHWREAWAPKQDAPPPGSQSADGDIFRGAI